MKTKVGVIGAGNIGFGMCLNLLRAGFETVVCDVRPEPLDALRGRGAVIAPHPGAVGRACEIVFSVVLDYAQNLNIMKGPDGLLGNMAPGGCIFVCSTISPAQVRALADLAAGHDLRLLDCPVSGGQEGAMAGTLSLIVGGDPGSVEEHRTVLEAISAKIYHMGDVGKGEAAKLVNNLLVAVHGAATAEALLLAAKSGIDLRRMYDVICTSAGRSWMFEHRAMRMIERDFTPRGVLSILDKDTGMVLETAESQGLVLPLATIARQLFRAGVNQGLANEDDAAVVKVLEGLAAFSLEDAGK
jgi:putative dehydrogenase